MRIRPGRATDVPGVRPVIERAYGVYVDRIGRRPAPMDDNYIEKVSQGHVFVAEQDDVLGLNDLTW